MADQEFTAAAEGLHSPHRAGWLGGQGGHEGVAELALFLVPEVVGDADLVPLGAGGLPAPALETTGAIGEAVEGARVFVAGTTVGSQAVLADGVFVD